MADTDPVVAAVKAREAELRPHMKKMGRDLESLRHNIRRLHVAHERALRRLRVKTTDCDRLKGEVARLVCGCGQRRCDHVMAFMKGEPYTITRCQYASPLPTFVVPEPVDGPNETRKWSAHTYAVIKEHHGNPEYMQSLQRWYDEERDCVAVEALDRVSRLNPHLGLVRAERPGPCTHCVANGTVVGA